MRGELDWIVMKALEKDRNRRYETANSFAQDVLRYLTDEPVAAGPPSVSYRARKFLRRNRGAVAAAGVVAVALFGGIVGTTWGMLEAREAEQFASNETEAKTKALKKAIEDYNRAENAEHETRKSLAKEQETSRKLDAALLLHKNALYSIGVHLADREWFATNLAGMHEPLKNCPSNCAIGNGIIFPICQRRELHSIQPPHGLFSAVAVSMDVHGDAQRHSWR